MLQLLSAMGSVLLVWAIVAPMAVGVGLLVQRPLRPTHVNPERMFSAFWLGIAVALMLLQLWSFTLPINFASLLTFLMIGATGLVVERRTIFEAINKSFAHPWQLLITIAVMVWLANRAIGPCDIDDSGLYHFPIIRWANAFPVVPGLANLSPAFAMNNSSLLFVAMLNTGPLSGHGQNFANGVLLAALFTQAICAFANILRRPRALDRHDIFDVFDVMVLAPAVLYALGREISTPTTDVPVGAISWMAASLCIRTIDAPNPLRVFSVLFLSAGAVSIKLSAGAFTGLLCVTVAIVFWRDREIARRMIWKTLLVGTAAGTMLVGPWIARSVIQSGYPLYPAKVLPMPVQWRVPDDKVDFLYDAITLAAKGGMQKMIADSLSKTPLKWYVPLMRPPFENREGVRGLNWVRSWFFTQPFTSPTELVVPAIIAIVGTIVILRSRSQQRTKWALLMIVILPPIVFWFFQSPDRRYVWAVLWTAAAGTLTLASDGTATLRRNALVLSLACAIVAVGYRAGLLLVLRHTNPIKQIPFIAPGPADGFYPEPQAKLTEWHTRFGTIIYGPGNPPTEQVWSHDLPAAAWPTPDPDLRLRRDSDLGSGFVIDRSRE